MIASQSSSYHVGILDCPPGMSLLSESILTAADVLVVPLPPSPLAMRSLEQVTAMVSDLARRRRPKIVGFLSMVDRRRTIHRDVADRLHTQSTQVLSVAVPYSTLVERMGVERAPIATFAPRSGAALAYGQLWDAVSAAL